MSGRELSTAESVKHTDAISQRFSKFIDRLQGAPASDSARVAWLAEMFDTHRNTPRGWVFDNKIPHRLEQMVATLVDRYGDSSMDAVHWAKWIKWGGNTPAIEQDTQNRVHAVDHDFKRDLYLSVDTVSRRKGICIEALPKNKRWRLYDLIVQYTEASGRQHIDEKFIEGLMELLI